MDRQSISFKIGAILKTLREEEKLSHQALAEKLSEGDLSIQISKDSLRDYEISSQYRAKAEKLPNLGMRIEYLCALADFYGVSTDYLLGRTQVRTPDVLVKTISEQTGLGEKSIELLRQRNNEKSRPHIIHSFIDNFLQQKTLHLFEKFTGMAILAGEAQKKAPTAEGGPINWEELEYMSDNERADVFKSVRELEAERFQNLVEGKKITIDFDDAENFYKERAANFLHGVLYAFVLTMVDNDTNK